MKQDRSKNRAQILIGISIYIAVLVSLGMFNFFILAYNGVKLTFYSFWLPTLFGSLMYVGIYIATAVLRYNGRELNDEEYKNNEASIFKHRESIIGADFREYINAIDFKNKRETWEQKITTKLANHQMLLTHRISNKLQNVPENKWGPIVKWYSRREKRLKLYLTNEWILANLKYRSLVYPKITVSEVINGRMRASTKSSMLNRNHLSKQIAAKMVFVLFSLVGSAIFATLAITPNPNWLNILIQLVGMLIYIVLNTTTGFLAGSRAHMSRSDTAVERLEIIINYINNKK